MKGWVSFHRQIMKWEWYTDPNTFRLFFHLVLNANHEKARWRGQDILRGQFITSSEKLAAELGLSRQQIRTSLKKLISTNEITTKPTNKFTLVTIEKYDFYQDDNKKVTNKTPSKQPSSNQQVTTNNNDNNNNKEIIEYYRSLNLPGIRKVTDKRMKSVNARINDYGLDEVKNVLLIANNSEFLNKQENKSWFNFDWIFNPNNFIKILEGKYTKQTFTKKEDVFNEHGVIVDHA